VPAQTRKSFVAALSAKYGRRLQRFISKRLHDRTEVPDLAQEVFLRLMRVDDHEIIRSPEAYLFTVASHVVHQHRARQSSAPATIDIAAVLTELQLISDDDPVAHADSQQRLEEVQRALAELPSRISTTLLLHRFAGLSIEEIGRRLGVARPTAKKYLARALAHCRDVTEEGST
jgi:RNA polymerase sigma-70 factor (ECF subfamily)